MRFKSIEELNDYKLAVEEEARRSKRKAVLDPWMPPNPDGAFGELEMAASNYVQAEAALMAAGLRDEPAEGVKRLASDARTRLKQAALNYVQHATQIAINWAHDDRDGLYPGTDPNKWPK